MLKETKWQNQITMKFRKKILHIGNYVCIISIELLIFTCPLRQTDY